MKKQKKNKVAYLPTDFAKEQYATYAKQKRQVIFRRRRLAVICTVGIVAFISIGYSLARDYARLATLNTYKQETLVEQKQVNKQVKKLKADVALLEDDDYVAKLARSRYFYSKDGEINFKIPDSDSQSPTESSDK